MNEALSDRPIVASPSRRVVVLGGSIAGLLAARVLSDHASSVVVIERDEAAPGDGARKGVPQGRHAHGLLARGQEIFETLFPGIADDLRQAGAVFGPLGQQRWILAGRRLALPAMADTVAFTCARPLLEARIRERVRALPNVQLRGGCDVLGVVGTRDRVTGARILPRADGAAPEVLEADLVVDATGRGSKLPQWLTELGHHAPDEDRVTVGVRYSTVVARRRPSHADGGSCVVVATAPPNRRCGVALAIDAEHWILTFPGYLGESAGRTWEELLAFARQLPSLDLYELMRDSEPTSEVVTANFPHSQWRRYDRMRRHPDGIVAFGDAICSFNPIFGQGMTVAACEAMELGKAATRVPLSQLWRAFYRRTRPIVEVPWSMAVGNDLRFAEVQGRRTTGSRMLARYLDRLFSVAASDPVVAEAFLRVTHLLAPPPTILSPRVAWRVLRGPRTGGAVVPRRAATT